MKTWERRQVSGRPSRTHNVTCAQVIYDSSDSGKFLLPWRVRKCVAKTGFTIARLGYGFSFTNEPKIAATEVPVWNDGCLNLHGILHSDCL